MKKSSKIRKSIALMIVSVFSFSVVAYADNAYVSGELNRSGSGLSTVTKQLFLRLFIRYSAGVR